VLSKTNHVVVDILAYVLLKITKAQEINIESLDKKMVYFGLLAFFGDWKKMRMINEYWWQIITMAYDLFKINSH